MNDLICFINQYKTHNNNFIDELDHVHSLSAVNYDYTCDPSPSTLVGKYEHDLIEILVSFLWVRTTPFKRRI